MKPYPNTNTDFTDDQRAAMNESAVRHLRERSVMKNVPELLLLNSNTSLATFIQRWRARKAFVLVPADCCPRRRA